MWTEKLPVIERGETGLNVGIPVQHTGAVKDEGRKAKVQKSRKGSKTRQAG